MTRKSSQESKGSKCARRLNLDSDLTIYNAPEHKMALMNALGESAVVELDLAHVGQIDSAGLQVLLLAKRESVAGGKVLRVVAHSQAVRDLLDFFNVASYFGDPLVIPAHEST